MQNVASGSSFLSDYRELGDVLYVEVTDDFHYRRALQASLNMKSSLFCPNMFLPLSSISAYMTHKCTKCVTINVDFFSEVHKVLYLKCLRKLRAVQWGARG